jgi:hypothetical protein
MASAIALLVLSALLTPSPTTAQTPTPVNLPNKLEQWETSFLTFPGFWQLTGYRTMKGIWINGAVASLTVERFDTDAVVITRTDTLGLTPGISARYTGRFTNPGVIEGTVTWNWPGVIGYPRSGTWGAKFDPVGCGQSSLLAPLPGAPRLCSDANLPFHYDTQNATYHMYDDYTEVCSAAQSNQCTVENVFATLSETPAAIAPVSPSVTKAEITPCAVIQLRSCPGSDNKIRIVIDPNDHSITNYTLPTHIFYPGHVKRQIVDQNGVVGIYTVGEGVGCHKGANLSGGKCKIWPEADQTLKVAVWARLGLGTPPPLAGNACSERLGILMWVCDRVY